MNARSELRLLPWSGPDGKPCYLSTDDDSSHLSRLADSTEAIQLDLAVELLDDASDRLGDTQTDSDELRSLALDLVESLRDVVRVAQSRGRRLLAPQPATRADGKEGSILQAAAFGE